MRYCESTTYFKPNLISLLHQILKIVKKTFCVKKDLIRFIFDWINYRCIKPL